MASSGTLPRLEGRQGNGALSSSRDVRVVGGRDLRESQSTPALPLGGHKVSLPTLQLEELGRKILPPVPSRPSFSLFVEPQRGVKHSARKGPGSGDKSPRVGPVDDYVAHFHHNAAADSMLIVSRRLAERLGGSGIGNDHRQTAHDDASESAAEGELAGDADWLDQLLEAPLCVVRADGRTRVSQALADGGVPAAARAIAQLRLAASGCLAAAVHVHWEADVLTALFTNCDAGLECATCLATNAGARTAVNFEQDATACVSRPGGRVHGAVVRFAAELASGAPADVSVACSQAVRERATLKDNSLWRVVPVKKRKQPTQPTFSFELKRSAPPPSEEGADSAVWRSLLQQPAAICAQRTVVKATLAFDSALSASAGTAKLYWQRRSALDVVEAALKHGGGVQASGEDALFFFDDASDALLAALEARNALDGMLHEQLLEVKASGFGVTHGDIMLAPEQGGVLVSAAARRSISDDKNLLRRHPHLKLVSTFLRTGGGAQLDEYHQVIGEAKVARKNPSVERVRKRAKQSKRRSAARSQRGKAAHFDALTEAAVAELHAVTEAGDAEMASLINALREAMRGGNPAVIAARKNAVLKLHAQWCPASPLRTPFTVTEKASASKLNDWFRRDPGLDGARGRAAAATAVKDVAAQRLGVFFKGAPAFEPARNRALRANKRKAAAYEVAADAVGQFGDPWAKTAADALWPGAANDLSAEHAPPAAVVAVLVNAAGMPAPRRGGAYSAEAAELEALLASGMDSAAAAEKLEGLLSKMRYDGDPRARSDEMVAAGAAAIRARIQFLRSRCDDAEGLDAEFAADPRLLIGGPAGLSRIEAAFSSDAAVAAFAGSKRRPRTPVKGVSTRTALYLGVPTPDARPVPRRRSSLKSSARGSMSESLAADDDDVVGGAAAAAGEDSRQTEDEDEDEAAHGRRLQIAMLRDVLLGETDESPEGLVALEAWYRPYLVDVISAKRPKLQRADLVELPLDQLELLFGGLLMVASGFPEKFSQQLEYRLLQSPAKAQPAANMLPPIKLAAGETGVPVRVLVEETERVDVVVEEHAFEDLPVIDQFRRRLLQQGEAKFVDRLSGLEFALAHYAFGPASADQAVPSDSDKLQKDVVLAIRSIPCLPASLKSVLRQLREGGWTEAHAADGDFALLVRHMFDKGMINLSFKESGQPFEVW
ncbi:hypothetical protein M885DRAFT_211792 [Pelagophyceae sp. CCMP2097]|nr:hypothetical protein M885DRAFT_211792 [Pelagophyceae sp. CCMP2097]